MWLTIAKGCKSFGCSNERFEVTDPLIHHSVGDFAAFFIAIETFKNHLIKEYAPCRHVERQFKLLHDLFFSLNYSRLDVKHFIIEIFIHEFGIKLIDDFAYVKLVLSFGALFWILTSLVA